eukprot:TRINITY_DN71188_c0_g1_i1.p1 TRINITY_DN71188_c0_g1~~TRINITY_DN71188_c0_g1_i1.p1  ORF type:complete len:439 (+),score=106.19 TRINITY_DN71188_c0_g1_i1:83-1318(+)
MSPAGRSPDAAPPGSPARAAPAEQPPADAAVLAGARPCPHSDWDDVRQRKGIKVLRCRVCESLWKWPKGARRGQPGFERCIDFLNDRCAKGSSCALLHVHRRKMPAEERQGAVAGARPPQSPSGDTVCLSPVVTPPSAPADGGSLAAAAAAGVGGGAGVGSGELLFPAGLACPQSPSSPGGEPHATSGPPTPRGTAPTFHRGGPPPPESARRRANTPPPAERGGGGGAVRYVPVGSPQLQALAARMANVLLGMHDCRGAMWEVRHDRNNTIGMVPRPRASSPAIRFLGSFASFDDCRAAAERGMHITFTWHSPQYQKAQWRMQGYAQSSPLLNSSKGVVGQHYDPDREPGVLTARLVVQGDCICEQVGCFGLPCAPELVGAPECIGPQQRRYPGSAGGSPRQPRGRSPVRQ